ncbi:efflux RND transporter periplasmic adaptor subunit [Variovorax paradoxus]|jgi:RND family efflux transporter MFP subunit|uniref:efflux RND transporter periplasmic adaptor subunit n=1 Tax=Variovorax paradoxus TaxID=34073 RepID=UPI0024808152|nr:efflux RND transporter periplasmic adaptor subunit [Variovorax paradoxus]WGT66149.1 efflux RND transporter periplasmic adaptor subunit [Variovorax paradoxus]
MTASSGLSPLARGAAWLLLPALFLAGCSQSKPAEEPVRAVKLVTVGTSDFDAQPEFSAEVRARVESRLGFRVAGKIIKRQAELGQHVQAGQVLAQLDPQDYRLAAEAARAQLAAAQTNRDLAAADLKRYTELRSQNFISGAELERRESTFKAAQAQLEQAQAQLSSQGNQASYTSLVADVAGVITAIEAEPGQVVQAGTPVVRIAQDGARDVVFAVPEDRAALIKPGSPVTVRGWSGGDELQGQVREVAASADAVTRTYSVKVAIDAATSPALGATVYARPQALARAGGAVIKLPTSALRQEGKGTAVWVLDKPTMTVRSQPVQVATADGNEAVIGAGLAPGMMVVAAGVHVLSPGQKVTIYQTKEAAAAAASANESVKPAQPVAATKKEIAAGASK